jgi:hypothetical protein
MHEIWRSLTADQTNWTTVKASRPFANIFDYSCEYRMSVVVDVSDRGPWQVGKEPLQRPANDWVTRSVPFPFARNACAIIAGPVNLDYGVSKDLCADTHIKGIYATGFEADTGFGI